MTSRCVKSQSSLVAERSKLFSLSIASGGVGTEKPDALYCEAKAQPETWNGDARRWPWSWWSRCSGAEFGLEGNGSELPKLVSSVVSKSSNRDHKARELSIVPKPNCAEKLFQKSRLVVETSRSVLQPCRPGPPGVPKSSEKKSEICKMTCSKRHTPPTANCCLRWQKTKMLNIQMKVLEPKWKQEQRRSLQNTANKYAKLSLAMRSLGSRWSKCLLEVTLNHKLQLLLAHA